MTSSRRRGPIASRRRLGDGDEEEEDDDTLAEDGDDVDSHSEASVGSDGEDEEEDDKDDNRGGSGAASKATNPTQSAHAASSLAFQSTSDTAAMATGIERPVQSDDIAPLDFEESAESGDLPNAQSRGPSGQTQSNGKLSHLAERRRQNVDDNKKNGDSGTALKGPLAPSRRGGYFMHDQRSAPGGNVLGPFGRGRGRGRGFPGGHTGGFNAAGDTSDTINGTWAHDLHETVNDPKPIHAHQPHKPMNSNLPNSLPVLRGAAYGPAPSGLMPRSNPFSRTIQTGRVQLKVFIHGMKEPTIVSGVSVKQHTRLPDLRPPLRRDKPVRIAIPDQSPRYQFPKVERSFIFIPRAERPNQQGNRRARTKGFLSQQSSRRPSVQGGSTYTGSVNHSRRSSRAQSPAGSVSSRPILGPMLLGPPIVRLPKAHTGPVNTGMMMPPPLPAVDLATASEPSSYPLPQPPEYREARTGNLTIHQPRPQKQVSVAGIESPTSLAYPTAPQQVEQQPFHQQMPLHISSRSGSQDPAAAAMYYQHSRQLSYPSQASGGTPLSHIPDRAIHAQPFHPGGAAMYPPPAYYPTMYPMQSMYYYGPPATAGQPSMYSNGSVFVPSTPYGMTMDAAAATANTGVANDSGHSGHSVVMMAPPQLPGTLGHDGTTYFFDPSQHASAGLAGASAGGAAGESDGLAPVSYAVSGMGGMMTPSPDGYYYSQSQGNSATAAAGLGYYVPQEFVPSQ